MWECPCPNTDTPSSGKPRWLVRTLLPHTWGRLEERHHSNVSLVCVSHTGRPPHFPLPLLGCPSPKNMAPLPPRQPLRPRSSSLYFLCFHSFSIKAKGNTLLLYTQRHASFLSFHLCGLEVSPWRQNFPSQKRADPEIMPRLWVPPHDIAWNTGALVYMDGVLVSAANSRIKWLTLWQNVSRTCFPK